MNLDALTARFRDDLTRTAGLGGADIAAAAERLLLAVDPATGLVVPLDTGATLLPAAVTTAPPEPTEPETPTPAQEKVKERDEVDAVFAKLKQLGGKSEDKDE